MSQHIKTPIIPTRQTFAKQLGAHELNLEGICVFAAIGFFLDTDGYFKDDYVLAPGQQYSLDEKAIVTESKPWFDWHYSPRSISFKQALNEFSQLFETIIREQTFGKKVILPISGGLDSRTQAAALQQIGADVSAYSYEFDNGYNETTIAKKIAQTCDFQFQSFKIPKGYLWDRLDSLYSCNGGYSDFTAPRQMAFVKNYESMGDVFSLGHWGDVLFDSMNLSQLSKQEELDVLEKKLIKKGGLEFAMALWNGWQLQGDFKTYFRSRLEALLETIKIDDTNAKLRAFKSKYWAPRWTSVNLSVFESVKPIGVPYYDDRMCELICTIPEEYLKNRQLQIAYIQQRAPDLARITWQDQRPFNLNNFHKNKSPYNLPYRISNKLKRVSMSLIGKPYVQRNWELQFLGETSQRHMKKMLLESSLKNWIPETLISKYYDHFYNHNALPNAHAMNMLLVLSKFNEAQLHGEKN
ncbi:asparagine synthase-related protein [uncultured Psychroserpens sp.]|uniref:asparagine synthase-related protein n=1 Tax=uncultured Psychroserpens sp. TaxID=255436 RepID=UPI00260C5D48|nr:asparagine synthase-related protein [uncultured Psychroserpens sp.]